MVAGLRQVVACFVRESSLFLARAGQTGDRGNRS
jgi:hypothetical protein